jgi:thiol-disulfide isomerase/thioredoxin
MEVVASESTATKTFIRWALAGLVVLALVATFRGRVFQHPVAVRAPEKRAVMPGFTLRDLDGRSWSSQEHVGQVVLVNFWATWCPPCREEIPDLIELQQRFGARGFTVAGISMDDNPGEAAPPFARKHRINYPVLIPNRDFALAGAVDSLPTSFLLDRRGRVAASFVGMVSADQLAGKIDVLLNEGV